jgi:nitroreductase
MSFLELAKKRESCRSYDKSRPVEKEKIETKQNNKK